MGSDKRDKPVDDMSLEELRERAGELGIERRSTMGKAELVSAIGSAPGPVDRREAAPATGDGEIVKDGAKPDPKMGKAIETDGELVEQVGKHPDVPADVPVQPGDALGPGLYPPEPQKTQVEPE